MCSSPSASAACSCNDLITLCTSSTEGWNSLGKVEGRHKRDHEAGPSIGLQLYYTGVSTRSNYLIIFIPTLLLKQQRLCYNFMAKL